MSAHPPFGRLVRCSTHGDSFARLQYIKVRLASVLINWVSLLQSVLLREVLL